MASFRWKGLKRVMAKKKNVKLSVPLMPKSKGAFNANFTDIVVGKLAVKKDDKYPGTIRFENDVPLRTEALIEEAVLESLSKISNQSSTTGYVVTVSCDSKYMLPCDHIGSTESNGPLPRGFDGELLELPILACILESLGLQIGIPDKSLCFGYLKVNGSIVNYPGGTFYKTKVVADGVIAAFVENDSKTLEHLARIHGLTAFGPDCPDVLLPSNKEPQIMQQREPDVNSAEDALHDSMWQMNEDGFISPAAPRARAPQRIKPE